MRPLDGIKVLDFTRWQNGAHGTSMLADLGADVLKVEQPGDGDGGRWMGRQEDGFCAYFEANNRGKKSLTLDIREPQAREIVFKLIDEYDVVTENFRPGFMDAVGLGYEELSSKNPRLIYAANSGFGPKGSWRDAGCFDLVAQGFGGAMVTQGGGPDFPPQAVRFSIGDQVGSIIFAYSILAALTARERFGIGQRVDSSLIGPQVTLQHSLYVRFLRLGQQPTLGDQANSSPGTIYGLGPLYSWYKAGDDLWFTLAMVDPKRWPELCQVIGKPELLPDPRSDTPLARQQNEDWLYKIMSDAFAGQPRAHWLEAFRAVRIVAGPINSIGDVASEPQFWDNGYLVKQQHPTFGEIGVAGIPFSFSETPCEVSGPAPELGQNTEEVLLSLGFSWEEMESMRKGGVI